MEYPRRTRERERERGRESLLYDDETLDFSCRLLERALKLPEIRATYPLIRWYSSARNVLESRGPCAVIGDVDVVSRRKIIREVRATSSTTRQLRALTLRRGWFAFFFHLELFLGVKLMQWWLLDWSSYTIKSLQKLFKSGFRQTNFASTFQICRNR